MFRRCLMTTGILALVLSSVCFAADLWETTPFTGWTSETMQVLLGASPWAGEATVTRVRTPAPGTPAPLTEKAVVTWTTALPMRQALVREAVGLNGSVPKDAEAYLSATPNTYIVALKIFGAPTSASYAAQAQAVQKETFLIRTDGRNPLDAITVEGRALDSSGRILADPAAAQSVDGGATVFVFQFSRGLALTMLDREVEFVTKVGSLNIKKKFKMKDMVYKGELAL